MNSRTFDLVVFGVTGFTGQLVHTYLTKHGNNYKIAYAGRNKEKVSKLIGSDSAIIEADINNPASLDNMCKQASVVLSLVGPFVLYGMPVVDACVKNNTHFIDITGEPDYVLNVIKKHHDEAKQKKLAILCSCGFDCVPSDILNFWMHHEAQKDGNNLVIVRNFYNMSGPLGLSGGTAASMAEALSVKGDSGASACSLNPVAYTGPVYQVHAPMRVGLRRESELGAGVWSSPFMMQAGNTRIVRRANCLMGRPDSIYEEASMNLSFFKGVMSLMTRFMIGFALSILPTSVIKKYLPKSGEGPREDKSSYVVRAIGKTETNKTYTGQFDHNRGGYGSTAVMVSEVCMALMDRIKNEATDEKMIWGVASSSVLREDLVNRLRGAGITIDAGKH